MDPATGVVLLVVGAIVVASVRRQAKSVERKLAALAKRRGLHCQPQDESAIVSSSMMCFGSINGQEVRIKSGELGGIRVSVATAFDAAVDIYGKDLGGTLIAGTTDPSEAGPGYFKGPEDEVLARMNHETRRWILEALRTNTEIVAGWLVVEAAQDKPVDEIEKHLDAALSLVRLLGPADLDLEKAIVTSVHSDPNPEFSRRCFEILAPPAQRLAAEQMVRHRHPETRLLGATADAVRWSSVLLELADGRHAQYQTPKHDSEIRRRAIAALEPGALTPERRVKLAQWVTDPVLGVVAAEACVRGGVLIPCEAIRTTVGANGAEVDCALAVCLGSSDVAPWPEAEALLLELLDSADGSVAVTAAESLGSRGTIDAVHPLMTRSGGFTRAGHAVPGAGPSLRLRTAARGAIAAIQARAGDAERGGLALTDDPDKAGGVGLVEGDEG